jgi:GTP cyclohydrolase I
MNYRRLPWLSEVQASLLFLKNTYYIHYPTGNNVIPNRKVTFPRVCKSYFQATILLFATFITRKNRSVMEDAIRTILTEIGEDPAREGLADTPARVRKSFEYLMQGYRQNPSDILKSAIFHEECNHMIIVRDIELYSMCEHHMLPFFGKCHIGYIARNRVYGVSKLARLVDCFSRRLQVQERLTQQIAACLMDPIEAEGVGVVIEAQHLCMMMRGVVKQNSKMITSAMLGSFRDDHATRNEYLRLIGMERG